MKKLISEPLIWFTILAIVNVLFFLLRSLTMLRGKFLTRLLIALSCLCSGLVLLPRPTPAKMINFIAGSIIIIATVIMLLEIFIVIFDKLKRAVFGNKDVPIFLPDYLREICRAMEILARQHKGALIIIRRNDILEGYMDKGIPFDAQVNAEALVALFATDSPVHDGAVIIFGARIRRIKTTLSLKTETTLPMGVGTRHRAAVGITEKTDAIALIVSEERGEMSIAYQGVLVKVESQEHLYSLLAKALKGKEIVPQVKEN